MKIKTSRLLLLFVLLTSVFTVSAQGQETLTLKGRVLDFKTRNDLAGVTVELLSKDSTVIKSIKADNYSYETDGSGYKIREWHHADFSFEVPKKASSYIIRTSFVGYKTMYTDVTIGGKLRKRDFERVIPNILMKADAKMLKNVSVTGSKVKFYYKGDTVVYNADAFVLAEGSMLDALIRQLPGVELKSDGKIYHNGKFVESLLLNGKDFFKGNAQMMLDNLPTYTVKTIKVYDKMSSKSEFVGRELGDKEYVMDVNLKKEYQIGMIANVEAGAGTADRYMGRLFVNRYTDHSRVTLYGNINNLNDRRRPGQDTDWSPDKMPKGDNREKIVGIDYNIDSRNKNLQLYGNAQLSHSNLNSTTDINRVNFINTGDTYDYEFSTSRNKSFSVSTNHTLDLKVSDMLKINLSPRFSYNNYDGRSDYMLGSFSSMQDGMSRDLIDGIYSLDAGNTIRKALVNRYKKEGMNSGRQLSADLSGYAIWKLKNNSQIYFTGGVSGGNNKDDTFNKYSINYGSDESNRKQGNQYYKNHPDKRFSYNVGASYGYKLNKYMETTMFYKFEHRRNDYTSNLYLLDKLDGGEDYGIGYLPSVAEYESVIDRPNSYESHLYEDKHRIVPSLFYQRKGDAGDLWFQVRFPVSVMRQQLGYQRGRTDTTVVRNTVFPEIENLILEWTNKSRAFLYGLHVESRVQTPDLKNLVNITDDTDPLNIKKGNSGLKNQRESLIETRVSLRNDKKKSMQSMGVAVNLWTDALAMGYTYDTRSGVRTYKAYNVDGNWTGELWHSCDLTFGRNRLLTFSSKTSAKYQKNVDMIGGTSGEGLLDPVKSEVKTTLLSEKLKLERKIGRSLVGIKGEFAWRNANSSRTDFARINAFDYNYGATAMLQLARGLQLGTDLTVYGRRGYKGSMMNGDDIVWNARLSYSMLKGRLTWMLDGFDILNQLNNVTRVINAQGRTETFYNALPRYAILHVAYKFHLKPKKK